MVLRMSDIKNERRRFGMMSVIDEMSLFADPSPNGKGRN